MNIKFFASLIVIIFATLSILFLHGFTVMLSILLLVISLTKHYFYPIKKEALWFGVLFFGGALAEILLVNFAHAWFYTNPQFYGIPVYMPIYWGLLGTTLIVMYDGFVIKK